MIKKLGLPSDLRGLAPELFKSGQPVQLGLNKGKKKRSTNSNIQEYFLLSMAGTEVSSLVW
jgi:hypothetical protein